MLEDSTLSIFKIPILLAIRMQTRQDYKQVTRRKRIGSVLCFKSFEQTRNQADAKLWQCIREAIRAGLKPT